MNNFPFVQTDISEDIVVRVFYESITQEDLIWHTDKTDRLVKTVYNEGGWKLQMDNCIPEILKGEKLVLKNKPHRLIKGDGPLIVIIYNRLLKKHR